LRPDGKTQVTIRYEDNRAVGIDTILISAQHQPEVDIETLLKPDLFDYVVKPTVPEPLWSDDIRFLVNPTGRFEVGGPKADTGLTGRKITVDTYGGRCATGGGAFPGKDPAKVDRSAAYMARYAAKNLVASGVADRCEIRLAYAIGVCHPVSVSLDDRGTARVDPQKLEAFVQEFFDFRPAAIIHNLDLRRPIYKATSSYGHFGRPDKDGFSWAGACPRWSSGRPSGAAGCGAGSLPSRKARRTRTVPGVIPPMRATGWSTSPASRARPPSSMWGCWGRPTRWRGATSTPSRR